MNIITDGVPGSVLATIGAGACMAPTYTPVPPVPATNSSVPIFLPIVNGAGAARGWPACAVAAAVAATVALVAL